ncbi:MAG: hypothetical protein Q8P41_18730 [Pseudomonadota bacterium]|nr:hypothetical protein [Pseudomonadota bacterium]
MEALREGLGIEARLVKGSGGVFTVAVDGKIVARKSLVTGFPSEADIVAAVKAARERVS